METITSQSEHAVVAATPSAEAAAPLAAGIMQALAAMITAGQTVLLVAARISDSEVLVTIQPPASENGGAQAIPLQVTATPEILDAELATALQTYVPARRYAVQTAAETAAVIKATADAEKAAAAAKASASKSKTTVTPSATSRNQNLTVTSDPSDASIIASLVTAPDGTSAHTLTSGVPYALAPGRYELRTEGNEHETDVRVVNISSSPVEISITLTAKSPSLF